MTTQISIITPVYNSPSKFISELYDCLKAQTHQEFEWLIINDGSTDPSLLTYLNNLVNSNHKIRLISHNQNRGLPTARNTGIRHAKAPYLFFIDADDLIDSTILEKQLLTLRLYPTLKVVNSYVVGFGAQHYLWKGGFHDGPTFLTENRNTSCFMAHKSIFDLVMFNESLRNGCEDWDFWIHLASKGIWGYTIPEFLFKYRRKNHQDDWPVLQSQKNLNDFRNYLSRQYPSLNKRNFPNAFYFISNQTKTWQYTDPNSLSIPKTKPTKAKDKTRLLAILPWLEIGGADQFNLNLLQGLKHKNYSITILCTENSEQTWREFFAEVSQEIFFLNNYTSQLDRYDVVEYLIKSREVETIFLSNSMLGYYFTPIIKTLYPSIKIVDYLHCEDPGWYDGGYPSFSALFKNHIDFTAVTSRHLEKICLQNGIPASRLKTVYINIDVDRFRKDEARGKLLRTELGIPASKTVIIFVGRLTEQKQPHVLINTIAELANITENFECLIIGDGPEKQKLLTQIKQNELSKFVRYLGAISNEMVMSYLDAADIFFLPSKYEGIALSIYEAMAKKLAVVAANVGGQSELVNNMTGRLVNPSNPNNESKEYAAILHDLSCSEDLRKELATNGRKRIEHEFRIEHMIEAMDVIFKTADTTTRTYRSDNQLYQSILNRMNTLERENVYLSQKKHNPKKQLLDKLKQKLKLTGLFQHSL